MENRDVDDDDDDVSFAKWMSSFWGHSWRDKDERGLRDRNRPREAGYRKASLPCPVSYQKVRGAGVAGKGGSLRKCLRSSLAQVNISKPLSILIKISFYVFELPYKRTSFF